MPISDTIYSFEYNDDSRDNLDSFLKKASFRYDVPSIHVAGTNGKSTVSKMLQNVYKAQGCKVGLFISSHYKRNVEEMIYIDDEHISSNELEDIYNEYQKLFKKFDLSPFDIIVFIALTYFQRKGVSLAVIETGIGGEYDSTNIFTPILSVITNVSIDHTDVLGVSLSEIARHKAGIIYNEVPTLIGDIDGDALDVIVEVSRRKNSKVTKIGTYHNLVNNPNGLSFEYKTYHNLFIPNKSKTNVSNACLVVDAIDLLKENFDVSEEAINKGLDSPLLPARFEIVEKDNITYVIDSAHNVEAIHKFREDVDSLRLDRETFVIFATVRDKNITVMLPEIGLLGKVYITTFNNKHAREESDYFLFLDEYDFRQDYHSLISELKESHPGCAIIITGSSVFALTISEEIRNGNI